MTYGIFVVKTQPDKFLVFERAARKHDEFNQPTGQTRYLFTTSSYSMIQLRYPLHELIEMPGFFMQVPFMTHEVSEKEEIVDSLTGGACGPGKDRCYIFDPCKNHRQQPVEAEQPKPATDRCEACDGGWLERGPNPGAYTACPKCNGTGKKRGEDK